MATSILSLPDRAREVGGSRKYLIVLDCESYKFMIDVFRIYM